MVLVEKVSKKLAAQIAGILSLDRDREEVIAYGALNLLHTSLSTILLILFGILTKSLLEILVISLTSALLRQYSGGAHATSPNRCAISSVILFGGLSQIVKYIIIFDNIQQILIYQVITLVFILYILYRYAPADNPSKRITNREMRDKLRIASFKFVLFLAILTVILWGLYLKFESIKTLQSIVCIHIGLVWQALSITVIGHSFIKAMDTFLIKIKI